MKILPRCFQMLSLLALSLSAHGQTAAGLSLHLAYQKSWQTGCAIPWPGLKPAELQLLDTQFSSITAENGMKPQPLHPEEKRYDFSQADALVEWAVSHGKQIHGHTLIWHEQCPPWFFLDGDKPATKSLVLARLREHVTTVVSHYKGRIASWDVVNEAIADGPAEMRDSKWYQICGEDFIVEAFKAAHAADPQAKLFYNDYNIELAGKREKALRLIKRLKDRQCPLDGIGIQSHWQLDQVPFAEIEKALQAFQAEGLSIAISELDIGVVPRKTSGAAVSEREKSTDDPYAAGCPPEILQRQAEQYAQVFSLLRRYEQSVDRVTLWGLQDGRSWLNGWPRRCTNYPLLWDRALHPKPAFDAVMRVAAE